MQINATNAFKIFSSTNKKFITNKKNLYSKKMFEKTIASKISAEQRQRCVKSENR